MDDILRFWNALESRILPLIDRQTQECLRCRRMQVTTAPDGSRMGVQAPYGDEVFLPYASGTASAAVGDWVYVLWTGSFSTARVCFTEG